MTIIVVIVGRVSKFHSLVRRGGIKFSPRGADIEAVDEIYGSQGGGPSTGGDGRRVERAVFETDRQLIEGDLTLPPAGYQSRFSDSLNRDEFDFVPLTDVQVTTIADGTVTRIPFLVLAKRQIRIAYPAEG